MNDYNIEYYNIYAKKFENDTRELDMSESTEPFLSYLKPQSQILDAGCGTGRDGLFFQSKGHFVEGFDPAEKMVEIASNRIQGKVECLSFQEWQPNKKYDAIWACASLPHVPYKELKEVLNKLISALKSNAVLSASLKYGNQKQVFKDKRSFFNTNESFFKTFLPSGVRIDKVIYGEDQQKREGVSWINFFIIKDELE